MGRQLQEKIYRKTKGSTYRFRGGVIYGFKGGRCSGKKGGDVRKGGGRLHVDNFTAAQGCSPQMGAMFGVSPQVERATCQMLGKPINLFRINGLGMKLA